MWSISSCSVRWPSSQSLGSSGCYLEVVKLVTLVGKSVIQTFVWWFDDSQHISGRLIVFKFTWYWVNLSHMSSLLLKGDKTAVNCTCHWCCKVVTGSWIYSMSFVCRWDKLRWATEVQPTKEHFNKLDTILISHLISFRRWTAEPVLSVASEESNKQLILLGDDQLPPSSHNLARVLYFLFLSLRVFCCAQSTHHILLNDKDSNP